MTTDAGAGDGDTMKKILDDVAAGRITAEEANRLLTGATPAGGGTGEPTEGTGAEAGSTHTSAGSAEGTSASGRSEEKVTPTGPAQRVKIKAIGRRVKVIGEPFLTTLSVEGPHVMEQKGDTYEVTSDGDLVPSFDKFELRVPSMREVQERFVDLTRELVVKVNPKLAIEIDVTAGSLSVERVPRITSLEVTAGSAKLRDVVGPIDAHLQGGTLTLEGPIAKGESVVKVEQGQLNLNLVDGASVDVTLKGNLSRTLWNGVATGAGERQVGDGEADLTVDCIMANVVVKEAA